MKRYIFNTYRVFFITLFASSILLSSCSGAEEKEKKYLLRADKYFIEKNYVKAKVEIKNVLQINAKNSKARVLLGKISLNEGDYRQALSNFYTAAEEDPKQIDARIELAKIHLAGNKDADAKKYIDEILVLDPKHIEARTISSGLYMRAGDRESAIRIVKEVLLESPGNAQAVSVFVALYIDSEPQALLEKINQALASDEKNITLKTLKIEVLKKANKQEEIAEIYLALIADNPKNLGFYDRLAGDYIVQGKVAEAEAVVRKAIINNPDSVDPILALVNMLGKVKGPDKAEEALKEFIALKPDFYALKKMLASLYLQLNKKEEAKSLLNTVIAADGKSPDALSAKVDLVRIYLIDQDMVKANQLLDEIFLVEQSNADARILSARIKMSENKTKDAIADLRTALKSDARSLEAYKLLAVAQERDGTPELALDSYFRALDISSNDVTSLLAAARLSIKGQKADTGKKLLEHVLTLDAVNAEATLTLINLSISAKDWDGAEKYCRTLIDSNSVVKKATGYNALGGVYSAQAKWGLAKQNFEQALSLSATSYEPLAGIVNALLADNKISDAIRFIEVHLKKYPEFPAAKRLLAKLYLTDKKYQASIDIYESLIAAVPEDESLYESLAAVYFVQKDTNKAEATYLRGLVRAPNSVSLRAFLGNLYVLDEKYEAAKDQYEIAHKKMPNSDMIKNNLAILLVNHLKSETNISKAVELVSGFTSSKDPNYLDTLGWVQLHAGNTPQAISFLQQAVGLKPLPEFRYHLGMAYQKNGQLAEAKRELLLATKDDSGSGNWLESARKALSSL